MTVAIETQNRTEMLIFVMESFPPSSWRWLLELGALVNESGS